jgi:DNA-binding FadR family transcriptional regulator
MLDDPVVEDALPERLAEGLVFRPVTSRNAYEETVERLLRAVKLGLVPPGERLPPERELAPLLGISRVTLRQAIRALEQGGYVVSRRGRGGGTFVRERPRDERSERAARRRARELGPERLGDALDLRRVVEPGAAELAAERATAAQAALLRELADAAAAAGEPGYRAADVRLHLAIAEVAGSPSLAAAIDEVQARLTDLLLAFPRLHPAIAHANRQHRAIVRAIGEHEPARARALMLDHVEASASLIRGFLA